ncbi:MAG: hypothetical protein RLZZ111_1699 [Planctomycetota bacterium]|jgi:two-component system chemotaxis sensor kinase CheA
MSTDRQSPIDDARRLLRLVSLELAFVDPHGGQPAEALRALVVDLDAVVATAPAMIRQLAAEARGLVETAPGVAATLTSDTLAQLHDWQPRIEEEVIGWSRAVGAAAPATGYAPSAPVATTPSPNTAPTNATLRDDGQPCPVLPADADGELVRLFCAESQDLLQDIEQGVLVLEERPQDKDTLATVFRAFHTFKGNASVMKLAVVQRLAHELESLLDAARRGTLTLDRAAIDTILAGADVLRRFVAELAAQIEGHDAGRSISLPVDAVIRAARGLLAGGAGPAVANAAPSAASAAAPQAAPSPSASALAAPIAAAAPVTAAPAAESSVPAAVPPSAVVETGAAPSASAASLIRVDTAKLDSLIDLVGELVIAQSMVMQHSDLQGIGSETLARSLGQLRGISSELQRTALSLRMVPIRGTFQKMARLVRDLAGQVGKELKLVLEGEETELDRTLVEEIGDPLVHMIRNAADHGIEGPAERVAAGKPSGGTITLRAFHKGGMVFIQITDDGRGLSAPRIRAKAVERGLIQPHEQLDDRDVLGLIFEPGFSLASQVTDLSGRGVGMDVVRRNIERLRGTIDIESAVGRGTTFTIGLPLTLAIIEGLLVQVGGQRFVVPTLSVRESFRPALNAVSTVQGRGEMVSVRGRLLPLLRLADRLGIPGAADVSDGIVMVLEAGGDCRCVLVDALVGKQEVVIKGLGETFRDQHDFAGAAILGDGRVGLILDAAALVRLKTRHTEAA